MIYLQKDDAQAKTNDEGIARQFEEAGFVRYQKSKRKELVKDFIKTFLAIVAGTLIASWVDPGADWSTLTVAAVCALAVYELFR